MIQEGWAGGQGCDHIPAGSLACSADLGMCHRTWHLVHRCGPNIPCQLPPYTCVSVSVWTRLYSPFPVPCSSLLCYSFLSGSVTGETFLSLRYSFSSLLEVITLMPLIHRPRLREAFVEDLDWAGPDPALSLSAHYLCPYLECVICLLASQTPRTGTSRLTCLCIISSTKHISAQAHTSSI